MEPNMLIGPSQNGVPAPMWFVEFFKVLGFILHAIPMNIWYAGMIVGLILYFRGKENGKKFAARLFRQMPVIISSGVTLGIVPLLFIQVAYYKFFYPATILMAWFWMGVIALLIPAYYGVYSYAWTLKDNKPLTGPRVLAGWMAAAFLVTIGFIFANAMSTLDHIERWPGLYNFQATAGAVYGVGLNIFDPTLWPRWLLMFGLAMTTTAVWVVVDTEFFNAKADADYKKWAWWLAKHLYTIGMVWFAASGTWYVFGTWSAELRETMFSGILILLTGATAVVGGLPWLMIMAEQKVSARRLLVVGILLGQVLVLALNAVSRQVVQNINIGRYYDILNQETAVQYGPLAMFLIVFVLGLVVLGWMIAQVVQVHRKAA